MKKLIFLALCITFLNCDSNTFVNNCFRNVQVNELIDFTQPVYQGLLVDGGSVTANNIDGRNIHIIRNTSSNYTAFDLQCPERDCSSLMEIRGVLITCPCDEKSYNYLQGGRLIDGDENDCAMLVYNVTPLGSNAIQITN